MESNSDDDGLELPKPKSSKDTIDALKSLQKEKKTLQKEKKPMSEAHKAQFAKMRAAREENCKLRAEAKALLLKNKESIEYTKEQKKSFKKKELEELKVLLGKNKQQENLDQPLPVAEPKQTNKPKKVIEQEESESESEEEVIVVKKKPKPKSKTKKKVTVYLSSDSDDESESDYEVPPPPKQKSRIQRPNQIQPVTQVAPTIDYKSFFC
jgi:hypothetical protein